MTPCRRSLSCKKFVLTISIGYHCKHQSPSAILRTSIQLYNPTGSLHWQRLERRDTQDHVANIAPSSASGGTPQHHSQTKLYNVHMSSLSTRETTQETKETIHFHTACDVVRWQCLHHAHYVSTSSLPLKSRHEKRALVESKL